MCLCGAACSTFWGCDVRVTPRVLQRDVVAEARRRLGAFLRAASKFRTMLARIRQRAKARGKRPTKVGRRARECAALRGSRARYFDAFSARAREFDVND